MANRRSDGHILPTWLSFDEMVDIPHYCVRVVSSLLGFSDGKPKCVTPKVYRFLVNRESDGHIFTRLAQLRRNG